MNRKIIRNLTVSALALGALGFTAPAQSQTATSRPAPIVVTECKGGIATLELVEVAAYDVTFHNTAGVAADDVRLVVPYGRKKSASYEMKGTFAPQVEIKRRVQRTVGVGLYTYESTDNTCTVEYVHFVDGTAWTPR